jgi:hypothetical protein
MSQLNPFNSYINGYFPPHDEIIRYNIEALFTPTTVRKTSRCKECNKFTKYGPATCTHCGSTNLSVVEHKKDNSQIMSFESIQTALAKVGLIITDVRVEREVPYRSSFRGPF